MGLQLTLSLVTLFQWDDSVQLSKILPLSKSIEDIERKASLILSQGNPLLMNGMRPVTPNVVYVGMMQCRPAKKLPDDIQKVRNKENNS